MATPRYLRIAVPTPINSYFDYLPPLSSVSHAIAPGIRVLVPFGRQRLVGCLIDVVEATSVPAQKLKRAIRYLDDEPLLGAVDLEILRWASRYYHHAPGEVFMTAFPVALRGESGLDSKPRVVYQLAYSDTDLQEVTTHAVRQRALQELLVSGAKSAEALNELIDWSWRPAMAALIKKRRVITVEAGNQARKGLETTEASAKDQPPEINSAQQQAVLQVEANPEGIFLLDGVTGSGKTEVYLQLISQIIAEDKQVLVLLPEIALTPQLETRFRKRLDCTIGRYHSNMTERERADVWVAFQKGHLSLLLGTRSAAFIPMANPGLIVLDEEHDASFKQQEGFKFHARDIAVIRAKHLKIPLVMGSATPSYESIRNYQAGRYIHLGLPDRAGGARPPDIRLVDIRQKALRAGLSETLTEAIRQTLGQEEQVILFLNRRGFAPVQICHACGWVVQCRRCDANMTFHKSKQDVLNCHHCGYQEQPKLLCEECQSSDIRLLGQGTQRLEEQLGMLFPEMPIIRLDRDTTRRKGALDNYLEQISKGEPAIILGTQMLAKGHHFPNVTLVGIVEGDAGLFSTDFRAPERMAQMITQVAGRAGRAAKSGQVLIQTRHPDNPLLQTLLKGSYAAFAESDLKERQLALLPPFSYQALLRVSAHDTEQPKLFINQLMTAIQPHKPENVDMLGPVPAMIPRLSGRYRFQLLIQSEQRRDLHNFIQHLSLLIDHLPTIRAVRWSIDIDPLDFS